MFATDEGLRGLLASRRGSDWWDTAPGQTLLREIRRRAVRNASHIAARADIPTGRNLVDDIVAAAWLVLHDHADIVTTAADHGPT